MRIGLNQNFQIEQNSSDKKVGNFLFGMPAHKAIFAKQIM